MKSAAWVKMFAAGVALAASISVQGQGFGGPSPAAIAAAAAKPTPKRPDGRPDLSGVWARSMMETIKIPGERTADGSVRTFGIPGLTPAKLPPEVEKLSPGERQNYISRQRDLDAIARRAAAPNQPPYKPELLAKVKANADKQIDLDGTFYCKPAGVPRMGPPSQIVQQANGVAFLYEESNTFRFIPTDGRPHRNDAYNSYMGDSVGHWDGDTLVVDVTHLTDESWLNQDGSFHSNKMHVVERLRREGDVLRYQATVEDPEVFTRPWVMDQRSFLASTELLVESEPCEEVDRSHMVNYDRH